MSVRVQRPDSTKPRKWQAFCDEHMTGLNSSKPSCLNWADQHVKDEHPSERVQVLN